MSVEGSRNALLVALRTEARRRPAKSALWSSGAQRVTRRLIVIAGAIASMVIYSAVWETVRAVGWSGVLPRRQFEESEVVDDASRRACLPVRSRRE